MNKQPFEFVVDLPVLNRWESVDLLRMSILDGLSAAFHVPDRAHAFSTIAAELLENAIKYGHWENDTSHLHLRLWGAGGGAFVCVENPVDKDSGEVGELFATIDWLKKQRSAEEAYRHRLLDVAVSRRGSGKLGLVRIAYEGACTLHAELEGSLIRVTGATRF